MRKLIVCLLLLSLLFPTAAFAEKPTDEGTTNDSTHTTKLFGYVIVVVAPVQEGEAVSVGVFSAGANGEAKEKVTCFTLGGILGSSVSTLAKTVKPGPGHGKVVSAFMKTVNEERRIAKQAEIEEKKAAKKEAVGEKKAEIELKKTAKEEAKAAKKAEIAAKKANNQVVSEEEDVEEDVKPQNKKKK